MFEAGVCGLREEPGATVATLTAHAATPVERESLKGAVVAWAETARARVELRESYEDGRSWATAWMRYWGKSGWANPSCFSPWATTHRLSTIVLDIRVLDTGAACD